jgi:radical SAM protein with 4Fe4S-binding SPASM domain
MVRYAADHGLTTFTSTNGHFFGSEDMARRVVQSGLSELIICLDGADQRTIGRYRKNAHFEEILQGIRRILGARNALAAETPLVELQFIVMKHNEHQLDTIRHLARDLGVDRFIEKTVGINAADPDFQRLAKELLPEDLSHSRYERAKDGTFRLKGEQAACCEYIHSTMVVNSNGDVVPCCYDIHSDYVMGNVFEQSPGRIWRGKRFEEFRQRVCRHRDEIPICSACPEGRVIRRLEDVVHNEEEHEQRH